MAEGHKNKKNGSFSTEELQKINEKLRIIIK